MPGMPALPCQTVAYRGYFFVTFKIYWYANSIPSQVRFSHICGGSFSEKTVGRSSKHLNEPKEKTDAEREMIQKISASYDISDRKYIEPVLKYLGLPHEEMFTC